MRGALMASCVAAVLLLASAAPAAPPEYPVSFIKVDELKALLDARHARPTSSTCGTGTRTSRATSGAPARSRSATCRDRVAEIPKTGLVVFY